MKYTKIPVASNWKIVIKFWLLLLVLLPLLSPFNITQGKNLADTKLNKKTQRQKLYQSIVKIENRSLIHDFKTPWNAGDISGGTGTGFQVGKNLFLTNAHVVSDNVRLLVQKYGDARKHEAEIAYIAHDCDLALIRLRDPNIFDKVTILEFGDVPELESEVTAIGYPIGGERLSITRGVVSRIDFQTYSHTGTDLHLAVQIDAAINPGNSGGPVLQDGKVVGVAFQGYQAAENTGYMIPTPVIKRFLKDIEDGSYDRYVDIAASFISTINPAMRKTLGIDEIQGGYLVNNTYFSGSSHGILQKGDVVLSIDNLKVASDGRVLLDGQRVNMAEVVERKFDSDIVKVEILRDGERQILEIKLKVFRPYLIRAPDYDDKPRFVIFAGLLFQPLTQDLLDAHGFGGIDILRAISDYSDGKNIEEQPETVVLSSILTDRINTHFTSYAGHIVEKINGKKIRFLQDVYKALHPKEAIDYHIIDLRNEGRPLVIDAQAAPSAHLRIMRRYNISHDHYFGNIPDYIPRKIIAQNSEDVGKKEDENEIVE